VAVKRLLSVPMESLPAIPMAMPAEILVYVTRVSQCSPMALVLVPWSCSAKRTRCPSMKIAMAVSIPVSHRANRPAIVSTQKSPSLNPVQLFVPHATVFGPARRENASRNVAQCRPSSRNAASVQSLLNVEQEPSPSIRMGMSVQMPANAC